MRDIEYMMSMYPPGVKMLQRYVSEACDRLEYKNSPMYDQYPDQIMINGICDSICRTIVSEEGMETIRNLWSMNIKDVSNMEMQELKADMERLGQGQTKSQILNKTQRGAEKEENIPGEERIESQEIPVNRRPPMRPMPGPGDHPPMRPMPGPGDRPPMRPMPGPGDRLPMRPMPGPGDRPPMRPMPGPGVRPPVRPQPGPGDRPPMRPLPIPREKKPVSGQWVSRNKPSSWLEDMVKVLLLNEMYGRRHTQNH